MQSIEDRKTFSVNEVFTPTSPAIVCYVPRGEKINDKVVNALNTPDKQIVVYGHSGSGKTTLLLNKLRELYDDHLTSRCMKSTTVDSLLLDAFSQLEPFYESEKSSGKKTAKEIAIESTFQTIKSGIKVSEHSEASSKQVRLIPPQLNAQNLASLLGQKELCWVIEDFHKVDEAEKPKLSQIMKIFMDCAVEFNKVKIITLGAVQTARQVIEYDDEMRNRVSEIEVQLMNESEITEIINTGEKRLNIEFTTNIKKLIAKYSGGLPAVCHQLYLNACNAQGITCTAPTQIKITNEAMRGAIETYAEESSDTIRSNFEKALKTNRKTKVPHSKLALQALTDFPDTGASRFDLLQKINRDTPGYTDASLKRTLTQLQSSACGEIIRHSQNSGLFSFSDPIYHVYAMSIFHTAKTPKSAKADIDNLELDLTTLVTLLHRELMKQGLKFPPQAVGRASRSGSNQTPPAQPAR
jgi:GTPase SAR1 family protein